MIRKIIKIDEEKCNGCGLCIPNCPEGALQIIDDKARLVSDLACDGLGACIGHCPEGAIIIEEREAEAYNESKVMENIIPQGTNTIKAHLEHLKDHAQTEFLAEAIQVLKNQNISIPDGFEQPAPKPSACGCAGMAHQSFDTSKEGSNSDTGTRPSQLSQWPVQLHLLSPAAPFFEGKELLLSADCVAHAYGDFHKDFVKGNALAIACPKLDSGQDDYVEKLTEIIDNAGITALNVVIMQVPCCGGLFAIANKAMQNASKKIPLKRVIIGIKGEILQEDTI